jgi:hypothetical protein
MGAQSGLWRMLIPQDSPQFGQFSIGAICLALVAVIGLVVRSRERGSSTTQNAELLKALVNMVQAQDARAISTHKECLAMIQVLGDMVRDFVGRHPPPPLPPAI